MYYTVIRLISWLLPFTIVATFVLVVAEVGELKMSRWVTSCVGVGMNGGGNLEEEEKHLMYMPKHEPQYGEEVDTDTLLP